MSNYDCPDLDARYPDLVGNALWPAIQYAFWMAAEHDHEDGLKTVYEACDAYCKQHGLRIVENEG